MHLVLQQLRPRTIPNPSCRPLSRRHRVAGELQKEKVFVHKAYHVLQTAAYVSLLLAFVPNCSLDCVRGRPLMPAQLHKMTSHVYVPAMQVAVGESEALAEAFAPEGRHTVAHAGGHLVPAAKAHVARYRAFLSAFL